MRYPVGDGIEFEVILTQSKLGYEKDHLTVRMVHPEHGGHVTEHWISNAPGLFQGLRNHEEFKAAIEEAHRKAKEWWATLDRWEGANRVRYGEE